MIEQILPLCSQWQNYYERNQNLGVQDQRRDNFYAELNQLTDKWYIVAKNNETIILNTNKIKYDKDFIKNIRELNKNGKNNESLKLLDNKINECKYLTEGISRKIEEYQIKVRKIQKF